MKMSAKLPVPAGPALPAPQTAKQVLNLLRERPIGCLLSPVGPDEVVVINFEILQGMLESVAVAVFANLQKLLVALLRKPIGIQRLVDPEAFQREEIDVHLREGFQRIL